MKDIITALTAIGIGAIIRFIIHQVWVVNADYFLDPLIAQFYEHIKLWAKKEGHPKRNALRCPDCDKLLRDLPN